MYHLHCSPEHFDEGVRTGSCYTEEDLRTIALEYNKHSSNQKVNLKVPKKALHAQIKKKLKPKCGDKEYCWLEQGFIDYRRKRDLEDAFRPKKPKEWYNNNKTWLNTYDILYVMEQYENKYKDFLFLGVYPIDFAQKTSSGSCIGDQMCSFNIRNMLAKGKRRFGLVINTDPHDKGGQHWFALYCNVNRRRNNFGIYYYDSVAYPASPLMKDFMAKIKSQVDETFSKKLASRFEVKHNVVRRQYKNTECGVFSIVFLTQCLKNIPFDEVCKRMRTDDEVNKLRDVLYRPQ